MPGSDALSEPGIGSGAPLSVDAVARVVVVVVVDVLVELLEVDVLVAGCGTCRCGFRWAPAAFDAPTSMNTAAATAINERLRE